MSRRLVFATENRGKLRELERLLEGLDVRLLSLSEAGVELDVVEDGETFAANAEKKARAAARATGLWSLADDSGLAVDALAGAPGVRSRRFAGEHASDRDNNQRLLERMRDVPDEARSARFLCALCLCDPSAPAGAGVHFEHGRSEGWILREPRGQRGFGYDPVFRPEGETRSMAELTPEDKDRISHRGRAARAMAAHLRKVLAQ